MADLNYWAILCAAASAFLLGGIWYAEFAFGKIWKREAGVGDDQHQKGGHGVRVFAISFLLSLVAAMALAMLLGPKPPLDGALQVSLIVGTCFVATSFGINYLFACRSTLLFVIDGGYHVVQFALYGLILGLWH